MDTHIYTSTYGIAGPTGPAVLVAARVDDVLLASQKLGELRHEELSGGSHSRRRSSAQMNRRPFDFALDRWPTRQKVLEVVRTLPFDAAVWFARDNASNATSGHPYWYSHIALLAMKWTAVYSKLTFCARDEGERTNISAALDAFPETNQIREKTPIEIGGRFEPCSVIPDYVAGIVHDALVQAPNAKAAFAHYSDVADRISTVSDLDRGILYSQGSFGVELERRIGKQ